MEQAHRLLSFIRSESYLPIDGLLLLFFTLHHMFSETYGQKILVPRIRNITWLYRTVARLKNLGPTKLCGLFDYTSTPNMASPTARGSSKTFRSWLPAG